MFPNSGQRKSPTEVYESFKNKADKLEQEAHSMLSTLEIANVGVQDWDEMELRGLLNCLGDNP